MITANEIRIGNCIWDDVKNHVKFVNHRVISDLASHSTPLPYSPIYITPKILTENCGFSCVRIYTESDGLHRMSNGMFSFDYMDNKPIIIYNERKDRKTQTTEVVYLHHFQNLYYVSTLTELNITDSHKITK